MVLISGRASSQPTTNSGGPGGQLWPLNPPVGIGTQLCLPVSGPQNALQINYDTATIPTPSPTLEAIIRLSNANGAGTLTNTFGILGLMPPTLNDTFSTLSKAQDLILHENQGGDIILTNFWPAGAVTHRTGGSIRFATAGDTSYGHRPSDTTLWRKDYERMTIQGNGNVGMDLPPVYALGGLDTVRDQIQIGGGVTPYPGNPAPSGPLTMYGGSPFENMTRTGGGLFPGDWRYIDFNKYEDHVSGYISRFTPMSSSGISFSDASGGLLNFACYPYSSSLGMSDFSKSLTLQLTGKEGLQLWFMDTTANPYHHLLDILIPGDTTGGLRNTNGLTFIHTPLCITSDHGGVPLINFTNLAGVKPDIGDSTTWMLAVDGPVLAKEVFVLDSAWADYVFDPSYKLPSLGEVENYIKENHHLPDIESASKIAKTGVPVGRTEEALTKKVEELTLYIIKQNKKIELLEAEFQKLESKEK